MKNTFTSQFKADYQHAQQVYASRLAYAKLHGHRDEFASTSKGSKRKASTFPPTATEISTGKDKDNTLVLKRVEAVQTVESLYAGVLGDAKFRLTDTSKGKGKGNVTVSDGAVIPTRQTSLANA